MLIETLEVLNRRLIDTFGRCFNDLPNYRIVFSDEQFEKRFDEWEDRTSEGFFIRRVKEVREVPKYTNIKGKYLLEKLFEVPNIQQGEILASLSYECIWVFMDDNKNPVPPIWPAIELILEGLHDRMENPQKYKDPESGDGPEETNYKRQQKIKELAASLFPNETEIGDALRYKEGIVVPSNFVKES